VTVEAVFWTAAFIVVYVYVAYPVLLALWARIAPRPVVHEPATPPVSIIVAARNEADRLAARLDNLLAQDYPKDRVQIVVVSDGSIDGTPEVLRRYGHRIDTVYLPRGGKARALNAGVARARHDVLVFADVRQHFAPDALRALVAPLADASVGGVSGELVLDCETGTPGDSGIGEGVGGYWKYEKWLRRQESLIGSTMGATGAIYALRRSLWQPLPADTILDDVLAPMRAVLASTRVVFAASARAFDNAVSAPAELRRKIRTLAGNYQILWLEPRLLRTHRPIPCGSISPTRSAGWSSPTRSSRWWSPAGSWPPAPPSMLWRLRARSRSTGWRCTERTSTTTSARPRRPTTQLAGRNRRS
jgi:cellulose synthase/poly-beta-1,6-N-acetylglucosamine synthase-like glycosyltransferase